MQFFRPALSLSRKFTQPSEPPDDPFPSASKRKSKKSCPAKRSKQPVNVDRALELTPTKSETASYFATTRVAILAYVALFMFRVLLGMSPSSQVKTPLGYW